MSGRRRRAARPRRTSSGSTLASAFVLSLMLVILIFTQRQIANGVVDAFNAMTLAEGSADEGSGDADQPSESPESAMPTHAASVAFYEPDSLCHELARGRVHIAVGRGRASVEGAGDQHTP